MFCLFFFFFFFLPLYFFLGKAVQAAHRAKKLVNSSHRQMKDEEARRIATVDTFKVADKKIQELNTQLIEVDRGRKSAESA